MHRFIASLIIALSMGLAAQAEAEDYQSISLQRFSDQQTVTFGALGNSKPTYLKFWATWCKPCMQQMPHFEEIYQKYQDSVNVIAVNININEQPQKIREVIDKFGLTMPVWLDTQGELGVTLGLLGTPFSVLIDRQGEVVYTTHESDSTLDNQLQLLSKGLSGQGKTELAINSQQAQNLIKPWLQGEHLLFFTATWCDWYLEDTRPQMAQLCKQTQSHLNTLYDQRPSLPWHGIVNHLWTDDQAVKEFSARYDMKIHFSIDANGVLFNYFNIRRIPTILWLKDGKVIQRLETPSQLQSASEALSD